MTPDRRDRAASARAHATAAITDLFAGVPVSDLDAGIDWYTRFFGRPPDRRGGRDLNRDRPSLEAK
jgi:hypothetical protein